jgi:RHS repeat-associated protein
VAYAYDVHGSMLNLESAPARFDLRWDWNDMVHTIDLGGGGRAWYQYSADKQRCRKRIDRQNGSTGYWERIYLNGFELYRRYATAGAATPVEEIESHHVMDSAQRVLLVDDVIVAADAANPRPDGVRVRQQTLFRYQYGNHLGSACLEIDENADVISYEEYHPYGSTAYHATASGIDVPPSRYRYTGVERDDESGLHYNVTRYYAAWCARWTSTDPASLEGGINLFAYANNQPIGWSDTGGMQPQSKQIVTFDKPSVIRGRTYASANELQGQAAKLEEKDEPEAAALYRKAADERIDEGRNIARRESGRAARDANALLTAGILGPPLLAAAIFYAGPTVLAAGRTAISVPFSIARGVAGAVFRGVAAYGRGLMAGIDLTINTLLRTGSVQQAAWTALRNPQIVTTSTFIAEAVADPGPVSPLSTVSSVVSTEGKAAIQGAKAAIPEVKAAAAVAQEAVTKAPARTPSEVFAVLRRILDAEFAMMRLLYPELLGAGRPPRDIHRTATRAAGFGNILNERVRRAVAYAIQVGELTSTLQSTRQGQKGVDFWLPTGPTTSVVFDLFTNRGSELINHEKEYVGKLTPDALTTAIELFPLLYNRTW